MNDINNRTTGDQAGPKASQTSPLSRSEMHVVTGKPRIRVIYWVAAIAVGLMMWAAIIAIIF